MGIEIGGDGDFQTSSIDENDDGAEDTDTEGDFDGGDVEVGTRYSRHLM